jgi:predicted RNase H-like nuclease (RuvC/YqgF family)
MKEQSREELIRTLKSKLEEWNRRIDELEVQADLMGKEARDKQRKNIEAMRSRVDGLRLKIGELSRAGRDARQDVEQGVNLAFSALKEAFNSATSRFS